SRLHEAHHIPVSPVMTFDLAFENELLHLGAPSRLVVRQQCSRHRHRASCNFTQPADLIQQIIEFFRQNAGPRRVVDQI
ncbi:hypothetical protein, partial [Pseudomonas aeruginosa]|uniref:hypothetical protein n=1 Tax=Pseudomonas aeruginosa TaxID=287 RepID=UPI0023582AC1